jgi:O-antigen/teichoic acid export membrane protein
MRRGGPIGFQLAARAAELAIQAVALCLVPRFLGPVAYATFASALAVAAIAGGVFALGGAGALVRFVPAAAVARRPAVAAGMAVRLLQVRLVGVAVIALAGVAFAVLAPDATSHVVVAFVVLAIAIDAIVGLMFQLALAFGRTAAWSARMPLRQAMLLVGALAGYAVAGVEGAVAAIPVTALAAATIGVRPALPALRAARERIAPPAAAFRFGVQTALALLLRLVRLRGMPLAVAIVAGSALETANAAIAVGVATAIAATVVQVFEIQLPKLVEPDMGSTRALASARLLGWRALAATTAVAVIGIATIGLTLPLAFGERFGDAGLPIALAFAYPVLMPIASVAAQYAAIELRTAESLAATALGTLAFGMAIVPLVRAYGAAGGVAALLIGSAASAIAARRLLPGIVDRGLLAASLGAAAAVTALALALHA